MPLFRRRLSVVLSALIACPSSLLARVLDPIVLPTAVVTVVPARDDNPKGPTTSAAPIPDAVSASLGAGDSPATDGADGKVALQSTPASRLPCGSPALDAAPRFHSGSTVSTPWGLGWSSDLDHQLIVESSHTVVWLDGNANRVRLFRSGSNPAPPHVYNAPSGLFVRLTVTGLLSGQPGTASLREKDGTVRTFSRLNTNTPLYLTGLTDRNGNTVAYTRVSGLLTKVLDVHGRFIDLTYDASDRVASLTDSAGRTFTHTYDAQGRRLTENGPDGLTTYAYDAGNRISRLTYPDGGVKNFTYDAQGRVLTEDDGAGVNRRAYEYLADRTRVTDADNGVTTTEFIQRDGLKKPTRVTDPEGRVTTYTYDAAFNLATVTDPLSRITRYTYDARGNVTVTQDPAGGFTLASYEPVFDMPTQLTSPRSLVTTLSYDAKGNLTTALDPAGQSTQRTYDSFGHLATERDPRSQTTAFTYKSANGALATVTDPEGRVTTLTTDALSRVTRSLDAKGKATDYQYDASGNLTQVTDDLGGVTSYQYEPGRPSKRLISVTDAKNHTTSFQYDGHGRLISVSNALNQARGSVYDAKGMLTQTTNARGQVISYDYDGAGRLTGKATPDGAYSYAYDLAGNLTSVSNQNGSVAMTYDALNRVIQVTQSVPPAAPVIIAYSYDADGNRITMTTPWGNFAYAYDNANRLTRITNPQNGHFDFDYDLASRRTELTYPNGVITTYAYDDAGQATSIVHRKGAGGPIIARADYQYDLAGNRTSMTDQDGLHAFDYDDLHRLTEALHPSTNTLVQAETFSYDAVGNRLADAQITGYTYDNADRLTQSSSFTYTYDADGNMTSRTDRATNLTTTFDYDSENRLTGAQLPGGPNWTYKYDALGRRVQKSSGTAPSQITRYSYDGQDIIATKAGDDALTGVYTHGGGIDEPLALVASQVHFMHADALGSIVAHTSLTGDLQERVSYTAYGQARFSNVSGSTSAVSATGSPFAFTARELDDETGLYFHRNRQTYEPGAGRFFQADPIGIAGGVNTYAYVDSNPQRFTDAFGLSPVEADVSNQRDWGEQGIEPTYLEVDAVLAGVGGAPFAANRMCQLSTGKPLKAFFRFEIGSFGNLSASGAAGKIRTRHFNIGELHILINPFKYRYLTGSVFKFWWKKPK